MLLHIVLQTSAARMLRYCQAIPSKSLGALGGTLHGLLGVIWILFGCIRGIPGLYAGWD